MEVYNPMNTVNIEGKLNGGVKLQESAEQTASGTFPYPMDRQSVAVDSGESKNKKQQRSLSR